MSDNAEKSTRGFRFLVTEETATKVFKNLFLKEINPVYKQTVIQLREHLGLLDSKKTSPLEATAGGLLLCFASELIKTQETDHADEVLQDLFRIKEGETPADTLNRILECVIDRYQAQK